MKKIVGLLPLLLCISSWSQSERMKFADQVHVSVGRHATFSENLGVKRHNWLWAMFHGHRYEKPGHTVDITARHADGTVYYHLRTHNLRTNAGGDAQASQMANTATQAASCNYIAVSNDATAPAATDTVVAGEITTNGLARAQGTYVHTAGTTSLTVTKVFSVTGTQSSQKTGVLNASSGGTLCWEATYPPVTNNNGDTLTIQWTANY